MTGSGYYFEGETYPTLAAWERAWPAYKRRTDLLKAGATTVVDMERRILEAKAKAKAAFRQSARNGPHGYAKTAGTLRQKGRYARRQG